MDYSNYSHYSNPQNHQQATAYGPSQPSQSYDPSTTTAVQSSSYYYYDPQQYASYNPPQDYASYYYPQQQQQLQETNHQQQQQQPEHIQQYGQAQHELYYPQPGQNPGFDFSQNVGGIAQPTISHPTGSFPSRGRGRARGRCRGRMGGRISRGGDRGSFGSAMASTEPGNSFQATLSASAQGSSKPPRMAWCELCRVECNTPEILEQHRQGKRHIKNLKTHEELQNLKQTSIAEALPAEANEQGIDAADKSQVTETESVTKVEEEKPTSERVLGKRKMKNGRGGKFVKTAAGPKRPVEPKQVVSFICELCNVKCESQVVLESHVAGKKHLSNLKKCQSHGATAYGDTGLKVVYPPPPVVNNQQGAAELGSLLAAHGVSSDESQALLAQLIMNYVVSQTQGRPVSAGIPNPEMHLQLGQQVHGCEPFVGVGADNAFGTTVMNPPEGVGGPGTIAKASSEQVASILPESHSEMVIETEVKSGSS